MTKMHLLLMKPREFFKFYQRALLKRPYLVQAVQTGTLMGAGDIISQTLIERKQFSNVDYMRSLKFSSIGVFVGGPALHLWYKTLNKYIGSSGKTTAMKKVFLDQLLFAPSFLLILLVAVGKLHGNSWDKTKQEINENYFDILKSNYCIWPCVQLLNFNYVPLQYQVLLVQTVALFWNTYLSWKTNRNIISDISVD